MTRPRKTRSMRGVMVDFDLIAIKEQMAAQPAPLEVRARENFIDRKLRRRIKKSAVAVTENVAKTKDDVVTPPMPAPVEDQGDLIDEKIIEVEDDKKLDAPIVKQKARKEHGSTKTT